MSAETMAGFRQGGLSPRRRSRISTHLAGCDRCRRLDEDLAGVSTLLAGAQPPPIPEYLAARIQTALATEAASRVVRPAGSENGVGVPAPVAPAGGVPPGGQRWLPRLPGLPRSRVAMASLAAAAAVLVVIGGMYMFGSRSTGSRPGSTAAGAPAHRSASQSSGNGIALPATGGSASRAVLRYQHAGHQDSVTPVRTDTNFTPGRLDTQAATAVAKYGAGTTNSRLPASPAQEPAQRATTFGNLPVSLLQGCVDRIDAGELVLLVDVARYRGAPATVIVTSVTVIGPEQIWVVGTGCSGSRSDVLTHATMAAP